MSTNRISIEPVTRVRLENRLITVIIGLTLLVCLMDVTELFEALPFGL